MDAMFVRRRSVLEQHRSDGLNRIGPIKWSLALCVMAVFLLVYFSLWKGVRSTGKVSVLSITLRKITQTLHIYLLIVCIAYTEIA